MRYTWLSLSCLMVLQQTVAADTGDLGINLILSGEISPGIYGQVQLGSNPRPQVLYRSPVYIARDRQHYQEEPIYLHVPPDHAHNWSRFCNQYHACDRRVYFVKSQEYEPRYQRQERARRYKESRQRNEHDRSNQNQRNNQRNERND